MDQASAVLIDGRSPAESGGALTSPAQLSALEDALPVLAAYIADYESERNAYDLQVGFQRGSREREKSKAPRVCLCVCLCICVHIYTPLCGARADIRLCAVRL